MPNIRFFLCCIYRPIFNNSPWPHWFFLLFLFTARSFYLFIYFFLPKEEFGKACPSHWGIQYRRKDYISERKRHTGHFFFWRMRDGEFFVKIFDGHEMETTLDDFWEKHKTIMDFTTLLRYWKQPKTRFPVLFFFSYVCDGQRTWV